MTTTLVKSRYFLGNSRRDVAHIKVLGSDGVVTIGVLTPGSSSVDTGFPNTFDPTDGSNGSPAPDETSPPADGSNGSPASDGSSTSNSNSKRQISPSKLDTSFC